jgi:biopolymer transport protein ExbD
MRSAVVFPIRSLLALAPPLALIASCGEPKPVPTVQLLVTVEGAYVLRGQNVPRTELKYELKKLQGSPGSIELHIAADSNASYQAVGEAVKAARDAGIGRIGFVTGQ